MWRGVGPILPEHGGANQACRTRSPGRTHRMRPSTEHDRAVRADPPRVSATRRNWYRRSQGVSSVAVERFPADQGRRRPASDRPAFRSAMSQVKEHAFWDVLDHP